MGDGQWYDEDRLINVMSAIVLCSVVGLLMMIGFVTVLRWLF